MKLQQYLQICVPWLFTFIILTSLSCTLDLSSNGPGSEVVSVVGRVIRDDTKLPVNNAMVFLRSQSYLADTAQHISHVWPDALTDENGLFHLESLLKNDLILEVRDTLINRSQIVKCAVALEETKKNLGVIELGKASTVQGSFSYFEKSDHSGSKGYIRIYGLERLFVINGEDDYAFPVMPLKLFTFHITSSESDLQLVLTDILINKLTLDMSLYMPYKNTNTYSVDSLIVDNILMLNQVNVSVEDVTETDSAGQRIKTLDLRNQRIFELPDLVGNLTRMEKLYLDNNAMESVPHSIGNLTRLREVTLNNNSISFLPISLLNLDTLQVFDVGYNKLIHYIEGRESEPFVDNSPFTHWLDRNDPDWKYTQKY